MFHATYRGKDGRKFEILRAASNRCGSTLKRRSERKDGTWTDWYPLNKNKIYDFGKRID